VFSVPSSHGSGGEAFLSVGQSRYGRTLRTPDAEVHIGNQCGVTASEPPDVLHHLEESLASWYRSRKGEGSQEGSQG